MKSLPTLSLDIIEILWLILMHFKHYHLDLLSTDILKVLDTLCSLMNNRTAKEMPVTEFFVLSKPEKGKLSSSIS
jgi:hypothetical protein